MLPASSHCLVVPVVPPGHFERNYARERQQEAARRLRPFVIGGADQDINAAPFSGGGL
jgi:hypothetical protein